MSNAVRSKFLEGTATKQMQNRLRGCQRKYSRRPSSLLVFFGLKLGILILLTAIGGRPKPEICFLPGRLGRTLLPKERYGDSLSGRGSITQPSNLEADTLR